MTNSTDSNDVAPIPLACVPGAIEATERVAHFILLRRLFGEQLRERRAANDLPHGYEFRFDPDAFADLMQFVSNERLCCPFLAFDLSVARNEGPVWLKMSGPPGTRAFLDAEFQSTPG